jgi:hypothetical protein
LHLARHVLELMRGLPKKAAIISCIARVTSWIEKFGNVPLTADDAVAPSAPSSRRERMGRGWLCDEVFRQIADEFSYFELLPLRGRTSEA